MEYVGSHMKASQCSIDDSSVTMIMNERFCLKCRRVKAYQIIASLCSGYLYSNIGYLNIYAPAFRFSSQR